MTADHIMAIVLLVVALTVTAIDLYRHLKGKKT